jgi:hypothetical protein
MASNTATTDTAELNQMQSAYKAAVEEWIAAIKHEEALASSTMTSPKSTSGKRRISKKTRSAPK